MVLLGLNSTAPPIIAELLSKLLFMIWVLFAKAYTAPPLVNEELVLLITSFPLLVKTEPIIVLFSIASSTYARYAIAPPLTAELLSNVQLITELLDLVNNIAPPFSYAILFEKVELIILFPIPFNNNAPPPITLLSYATLFVKLEFIIVIGLVLPPAYIAPP